MEKKFLRTILIFILSFISCDSNSNTSESDFHLEQKIKSLESEIYLLKKRVKYLEEKTNKNSIKNGNNIIIRDARYKIDDGFYDDPFIGAENPDILIVVYSDFNCKQCKLFLSTSFKELFKKFTHSKNIQLRLRDYPLSNDPISIKLATAAHCAGEKGAYWDFLFAVIKHDVITAKIILETIENINYLNINDFKKCFDSTKYAREISTDKHHAKKLGISGTPALFIGKKSNQKEFYGSIIRGNQPLGLILKELDLIRN